MLFSAIPVSVELLAFLVIFGFKAPVLAWLSVVVTVGMFGIRVAKDMRIRLAKTNYEGVGRDARRSSGPR